ncbi:MAG: acyltransferase [Spirochaetia bacterium]|nr:acyltransferase [Spirochaetia bacterium]
MSSILDYFTSVFKKDPREMASLNGIRAMAIVMLFLVHLMHAFEPKTRAMPWWIENFLFSCSSSIDMFFVLSGFLISGQLMREMARSNSIDFKMFYLKRTLRIFPPYYLFLAFQTFYLIPMAVKFNPALEHDLGLFAKKAIWDALYLSNYISGTIPHGWSLSLEEQFYLFFPLFLFLVFRVVRQENWLKVLLILYVLPVIYRFVIHFTVLTNAPDQDEKFEYLTLVYFPTHGHIDSIFAGSIAAYIFDFRKDLWSWMTDNVVRRRLLLAGALTVWAAISFGVHEYKPGIMSQVVRYNIYAIVWVIILLCSAKEGTLANKVLSLGIFNPLAKLSYCAYLLHIFAIGMVIKPLAKKPFLTWQDLFTWWIPVSVAAMAYAYLFHLIGEKPFMLLRDALVQKLRKPRPAPAA